jgi:hypothetical protein
MILGATVFENEAETIVSIPRNLCDEPHDTAVENAAKTGSTAERIEQEICLGLSVLTKPIGDQVGVAGIEGRRLELECRLRILVVLEGVARRG